MGISQSSVLKMRATVLKYPGSALKSPESQDLSKIDQAPDLPLGDTKYQAWRSEYVRPWNDMLFVDYNKKKDMSPKDAATCSEAIGYGMLISVLMHNQKDFDGFMRWFLHFKDKAGLLAWQQVKHGNSYINNPDGGGDSATDGDVDVCTAFFYAAHVWGKSADGKHDYRQLGTDLCKAIWDNDINHTTFMPLLGDWSKDDKKFLYVTRPSDFILTAFVTFQKEDTERSVQWGKVIDAIISTLQRQLKKYPHGLIADFMKGSAKGNYDPVRGQVLESKNDKDYNWNSCRVPWRLSVYYLLTKDERVKPIISAQAKFFASVKSIKAGYKLNGKPLVDYGDLSFTAPATVALWVLQDPALGQVLKQMKDVESEKSYYGDSIELLCLLQARNPLGYDKSK
ncbi:hypothetical protein BGZ83_001858 [Gryganskiella cystojenkinii]|nr:hypothetical protein BGZ83_001858 [Gryganskiella cystojenkinii]